MSITSEEAEQMLRDMDAAFEGGRDEDITRVFADDATVESPLVSRVLGKKEGVCRGHGDIRALVVGIRERGKPWGGHRAPIVRGDAVVVEFFGPGTDEPFSVDVIEMRDGKIRSLRAYLGWRALAAVSR